MKNFVEQILIKF